MERLYAVILAVTGIILVTRMFFQSRSGESDIFSVRNFFLVGYVMFVLLSGVFTLGYDFYPHLQITDPVTSGGIYTILALGFLGVFWFTYRRGFIADRLAARVRPRYRTNSPIPLLVIAVLFVILSLLARFVVGRVAFLGVLTQIMSIGFASTAAGLAAWAWAPRPLNLAIATAAIGIIFVSMGIALYQAFGRREVLSVMLACLWGAHYGHWRLIGVKRAMYQILPVLAALVFLLASFTGVRTLVEGKHLGFVESFRRATQGDVSNGILQMVAQDSASCSLWLIESRPNQFPYDTFHSFRYFITHPIPRVFWEHKPNGLGLVMVDQASVKRKAKGFNFGPGMPGHLMNDNPWLSLIPYAMGIAILIRLMDRLIMLHSFNPFVVIPMGVAVGEILAVPRGELGLFMFRTVASMTGAWVGMSFCAMLAGSLGVRAALPSGESESNEPDSDDPGSIDPELAAAYGEDDGAISTEPAA